MWLRGLLGEVGRLLGGVGVLSPASLGTGQ